MAKDANMFSKKVDEWGKTKFKPILKETTTRTSQNPFTKTQNFNSVDDNEIGHFKKGGFNGRGGKFNGNNKGRGGRFNGKNNNNNFVQNNRGTGKYQKDNDRVRFNPVARDAKPDIATPWTKFKDEINHKQREETQAASQANMDTNEAKNVLKQREMNYRRLLMEQKKCETIHWEDFGEIDHYEGDNCKRKKIKQNPTAKKQLNTPPEIMKNIKNNSKELQDDTTTSKNNTSAAKGTAVETKHVGHKSEDCHIHFKIKEINSEGPSENEGNVTNSRKKNKRKRLQKELQLNTNVTEIDSCKDRDNIEIKCTQLKNFESPEATDEGSKRKKFKKTHLLQKKNETLSEENGANVCKFIKKDCEESKPFLSKDELKDFNAHDLSFHQKDALRRIITKSVIFKMGSSLEQCVQNRKYQLACKEKKKRNKK